MTGKVLVDFVGGDRTVIEEFRNKDKVYKVDDNEKDFVHFEFQRVHFNNFGELTTLPEIQIVPPRAWEMMRKYLINHGINYVKILHAPKSMKINLMVDPGKKENLEKYRRVKFYEEIDIPGDTKRKPNRRELKAQKDAAKTADKA